MECVLQQKNGTLYFGLCILARATTALTGVGNENDRECFAINGWAKQKQENVKKLPFSGANVRGDVGGPPPSDAGEQYESKPAKAGN